MFNCALTFESVIHYFNENKKAFNKQLIKSNLLVGTAPISKTLLFGDNPRNLNFSISLSDKKNFLIKRISIKT